MHQPRLGRSISIYFWLWGTWTFTVTLQLHHQCLQLPIYNYRPHQLHWSHVKWSTRSLPPCWHTICPQATDCTLDPIHHLPFLQHNSDLDSRTNPKAALLYNPDATLQDNVNGSRTMHHLPTCIDTSITATTFCLCYITSKMATKEYIRDLTTHHLLFSFRELHPVQLVNDATITADNDDSIESIQCTQHPPLNRQQT
jgi:hypothetical protein